MAIDPSKLRPVPKEDLEKFQRSIRENVIKPMEERRRKAAERAAKWRRHMLENDPP